MVHGAFNELWGPNEIKARWLPALRDGLWHHGGTIHESEVGVAFYGDLFRRDPNAADADEFERSKRQIAQQLPELADEHALTALSQATSDAVYDRTLDMIATMATDPGLTGKSPASCVRRRVGSAPSSPTYRTVSTVTPRPSSPTMPVSFR